MMTSNVIGKTIVGVRQHRVDKRHAGPSRRGGFWVLDALVLADGTEVHFTALNSFVEAQAWKQTPVPQRGGRLSNAEKQRREALDKPDPV